MEKATISKALQKLDTANDAHWTKDGLPMLSIVSIHAKGQVTREQAEEAAAGFNRTSAKDFFASAGGEATDTGAGTDATSTGEDPKDATGGGVDLNITEVNPGSHALTQHPRADDLARDVPNVDANGIIAIGDPLVHELLPKGLTPAVAEAVELAAEGEETVESVLEEIVELKKVQDELNERIGQRQKVYDLLVTAREVNSPDEESATMQYLRAQRNMREQKGNTIKRMTEAGMTPGLVKVMRDNLSGAPVDNAAKNRKRTNG